MFTEKQAKPIKRTIKVKGFNSQRFALKLCDFIGLTQFASDMKNLADDFEAAKQFEREKRDIMSKFFSARRNRNDYFQ